MPNVANAGAHAAASQLDELRTEVIELATDRDIYWKVQREVIQKNHRLLTMRSAFFDMLNDAYAHAAASRIRRLLDRDSRTVSLRQLIEQLIEDPSSLRGNLTNDDLRNDLEALHKTCEHVKAYVDQVVAHHDRNRTASSPTHRELNEAIDTVVSVFKRYYAAVTNTDLDVVVSYLEDPLRIFSFPWLAEDAQNRRNEF
jgi:hypothetical protein